MVQNQPKGFRAHIHSAMRGMSAACLATAIVMSLPAAAQDSSTLDDSVSTSEERIEITPGAADEEIAARLSAILDASGWFREQSIRVEDGIVFLSGLADSADSSEWAQRLAARTDGVVAVVNRLDVVQVVDWSLEPAIDEILKLADGVIVAGPLILLSLLILPIAFLLARLVARLMRWSLRSRIQTPFLRDVIARSVAVPVFLTGVYIVLQIAGLTQLALSLLGGAGVLGIVIGFAFRDIAENFLASLLLSMRRPFKTGDLITVTEHHGVVQSMNTRSTVIVTPEGNHIQIPNAVIFKSTIENHTAAPYRRDSFGVGIGYDDNITDAQKLIFDALKAHESVAADPKPMALIEELGDSTINLRAYYWFDGQMVSHLKLKSSLLRKVKKTLTDAGVSMPDAAREVIFPNGVPLVRNARPGETHRNMADRYQLDRPEPDIAATDRDLAPDTELLARQSSRRVEEGDQDLLGS